MKGINDIIKQVNAALEIVSKVLRKKMKEQNLLPSKLTETTGFVQMQYLTECVQRNALDTKLELVTRSITILFQANLF